MTLFQPSEIQRFLEATDLYLKSPTDLVIIGGAAAALAYNATNTTTDIDTINNVPKELEHAFEEASKKTGFAIPVSSVGVFDPPYCYEERLQQCEQINSKFLKIYVPEQHDLALMKMVRGYENDIQTICEIHKDLPFRFEILLERFLTEMTQVIGKPDTIRMNFLLMISELFGDELAEKTEALTKNWPG